MKALTANLATRPFRNNTVIGSIVAGVAIALLITTIYNLYIFLSYGSSYALLLDDQDRNRVKLEALEVEERSLVKQIEARDFATAFDQGSVANELILKRTFSWTELFNKLEELMPPEVMMSAIRPNVTSSVIVIRVEGVAKTHLAFLSLQENLLSHDSFSEVYPVSIRRLNPSRPELNFILNFNYRQSERAPVDTVVAEADTATPVEPPQQAAGGASADRRAELAEEVLRAAASANVLPVGRDGRPRTLEVIARRMVAPGGVYDPGALRPSGETGNALEDTATAPGGSAGDQAGAASGVSPMVGEETTAGRDAAQEVSASEVAGEVDAESQAATPAAVSSVGEAGAPTGAGAGAASPPAAGGRAAKPTASAVPQADTPARSQPPAATPPAVTRQIRRRRAAAGGSAGAAAAAAGDQEGSAVKPQAGSGTEDEPAAVKPQAGSGTEDEPAVTPSGEAGSQPPATTGDALDFVDRSVDEVYRVLGEAHGVRFVVDAAIDRNALLSVNLTGLSVEEASRVMSEVAGQTFRELRPGIYHVVAVSNGEALVDPAVEEETLPADEGAP